MDKSLSSKIFIGLFAGLVLGTAIQYLFSGIAIFDTYLLGAAEGVGGMFVSLIKLLVVPLVYVSIVCGIVDLKDISAFGRLGGKTFTLYILNTIIAITAALTVGLIFQPGAGANLAGTVSEAVQLTTTETPDIFSLVVNIVPSNPVQAFANGDMLQIIFMAILTGLAIQALDSRGGPAIRTFKMANEIMMKLVGLVMSLAPYGVFALMIQLGATLNANTLMSVAGYVALVVAMLVFWIFFFYPMAVSLATGTSPKTFLRATREQILFSLSTASSNATIPVTMRTLTEKLQVSKSVAGFGVPLGATMNMSGVSIYIALATMFVANAFGQPINTADIFTLGLTILLLSIGAGGVPGGGVVMVGVLLHQLGLPPEGLAIIAAVDRINDMFCTSSNVVGDTAVNTIVAKTEGEIGKEEGVDAEPAQANA
ncbi:dicarboxylate/amino acid:cation symporter [Vibrio diabolicus]|uniref:Dicarboxylate/amino acid:cation symporter n=7 Tax=Vibrio harveyi group TaxID=717610 RepID=A0A0T7EV73_9VIBR|nr:MULTISPECIES: dicarboxylate/amino acid:cation symporter [Vibrio]KOY44463.1 sodium:glutamate symporter [Vibrio parahaemolyticus]MCR9498002.1 dicarboxylate/amino acid:cation symporter [Vibrio alginolyticus]MEA3482364.1 dicarboxylate/amino acid:cation symporter [Pseudomonadota bacterium]GAJ77464.1 proton/glutamate symport protein [Vibrio sp. JCM 18905]ACY52450.1 proton/glutamate symport protein [Vibrio antiquarius]|eukprot:NODE_2553_length_1392_cov_15.604413_g2426_i0.p1 GENE.NODE_2553_length_1392_cov_15.604413_g2426_i0~~NODE_2553_length_1392_cov_15.604413_g2426_i0.p1  ORF type:complete len:425 (+),score=16.59 NODE_2553_length_1392_cov_15.604413_g2426_i0:70-1344(+)